MFDSEKVDRAGAGRPASPCSTLTRYQPDTGIISDTEPGQPVGLDEALSFLAG